MTDQRHPFGMGGDSKLGIKCCKRNALSLRQFQIRGIIYRELMSSCQTKKLGFLRQPIDPHPKVGKVAQKNSSLRLSYPLSPFI